jgi:uncharacterized protein (DUF169 family)
MEKLSTDLSIFRRFDFARKPVGVKFLLTKPEDIEQSKSTLAICEMLKEAQEGNPFYAVQENFECKVGPLILGMAESEPIFESGMVGPRLGIFKEPRDNRRIYQHIPVLAKDTVRYVAFSPLDKLTFEPDVLIVTATASQAEIILRAMTYTTGKMWTSKSTLVIGCSWLFVYPFLSGELNFISTGLSHGMKARQLFPDGLILLSIPYNLLPGITANLDEMEWVLPQYAKGKAYHLSNMKNILSTLKKELGGEEK